MRFQPQHTRQLHPRPLSGFTLTEVMVAALITVMVTLGALTSATRAYQIAAQARIRDNARVVLKTYADQFLRLQTTERAVDNSVYTRWLFNVTPGPTSQGLRWGELSDDITRDPMPTDPLVIQLRGNGDETSPATVTRDVTYINPTTGETSLTRQTEAAGYYLQATFTVSYSLNGRDFATSQTVLRAVP